MDVGKFTCVQLTAAAKFIIKCSLTCTKVQDAGQAKLKTGFAFS
jgi:hypothetical protein